MYLISPVQKATYTGIILLQKHVVPVITEQFVIGQFFPLQNTHMLGIRAALVLHGTV